MRKKLFLHRKKALCAFFLLLLSSCSKPCQEWNYQEIATTCPRFNSACITSSTPSQCNGILVELSKNACGIQMHLNVHSIGIPSIEDSPNQALVLIKIDGEEYREFAFRLQGGQRLLLTDPTKQKIIEALICNKNVEIKVSRYKTILIPDNFEHAFNRLCNLRVS